MLCRLPQKVSRCAFVIFGKVNGHIELLFNHYCMLKNSYCISNISLLASGQEGENFTVTSGSSTHKVNVLGRTSWK